MNNRDYIASPTSGSIAQVGCDQRVISMPDRSVSKKTPTFITANTVVVLCAIAALITVLAFLESRIRSIDHAPPIGAEIRSHSTKEARRDAEARRTAEGSGWR
jgi:hypothetical protein